MLRRWPGWVAARAATATTERRVFDDDAEDLGVAGEDFGDEDADGGASVGEVEVMGDVGFCGLGGGAAARVSVRPCSAASAGGAVSATST